MLDRSHLPQSLGSNPNTYVQVANLLDGPAYSPAQLLERLGRISPSPIPPGPPPGAHELVTDLRLLRILMPTGDGRWRRRPYLDGVDAHLGLRYCLLTLLLPRTTGGYWLPLLQIPDTAERAVTLDAWPGGPALLQWYRQADLVTQTADGRFMLRDQALTDYAGRHPTAEILNRFLQLVRAVRRSEPAAADDRLRAPSADQLSAAIRELQRDLLIDELTIRRIYRALIAGQHVILSGPPGTGKTQLAQRLPAVLWRDSAREWPTTDLDNPPDQRSVVRDDQNAGYAVELVTANEEWSARDLIGGIAPVLAQQDGTNRLHYQIQHGHLTRTVLRHYPGYDGRSLPLLRQRSSVTIGGVTYRGIWLVIDELNRAPIDSVFGSLLTTLGAPEVPFRVPSEYGDADVMLPADFRLIGTLNSFDRHFLNQMSEALKRRFTFIDINPPGREAAAAEALTVLRQTVQRLYRLGLSPQAPAEDGSADWPALLQMPAFGSTAGITWYDSTAQQMFQSLQLLLQTLRIYRKLGTAQFVSATLALFSGRHAGLDWVTALDAALADTVADQLQVLQRDELQAIGLFLQSAGDGRSFSDALNHLLESLPDARYQAHLDQLITAHRAGPAEAAAGRTEPLSRDWLAGVFDLDRPLPLTAFGLFGRRLQSFLTDHGL